ncbi:tyrosine-type recombinase/integrase (plasmid) [Clostridium tyrobutyricum]|jgi:integrase|uniref:Tyr recombinase domain-containing protein n=1 Tax=Clostridium tyrobutyricum DIVETGP TaxID=1408889 RepID=W6N595_CLOTY|nr:tyrosine-type recombinase/integrase [Clostridium tyrobutyricum]AND86360.1 phage integrase family protein [Clostridium tyrobutyricum]ANP70963.1 recombinase XerD [Clostridium tyrobutyricum]MBV4432772.1 tyrosine-type recombinase/integrase [Clostridium tyrobutyricum]MBV4435725.1 tyrosine-type recombinase/integrase [Clostridium tyrobutyricum]MBV4450456.1 tyrosine-type recombinase/integrase [Clostridium tyrobutyricum]
MERVEPIRSVKKINDLKKYLLGSGNMRNYTLVVLGLNSALRVSDILNLKWGDVFDFEENRFKTHVYVKEKKTGKNKKFLLNQNATGAILKLKRKLGHINILDYIFKSREGQNKPITRYMAIKIIKSSCEAVGIKEHIGCHSLRKTFGYHSWKKGVPIPILMELYNHSNQSITKLYLGISQDDIDDVYRLIEL